MNLSEDQILTLAPDESSKKSGKDLANPSKWLIRGMNESALWGECQGSGSKPYQTVIDCNNIAFKCSCPSRKFPCKHGLALALLYVRQKQSFTSPEAPAWVTEWLLKRSVKEEKKTEPTEKPADEAAQVKRRQAREQKVLDGMEELLLWVKDIVRNGIINMPDKGEAYWTTMAKRMVDAQAPGLAAMINTLKATNFFKEGWQSAFVNQLLNIYLVIRGYNNRSFQPELLQQDIRTLIGFTQRAEELSMQAGVIDIWLVLGRQISEEDSITIERNWLYAVNSNQYALVLQFLVSGQGGQLALMPGMYVEAELVYYASSTPMRALIKGQLNAEALPLKTIYTNWMSVVKNDTEVYARLPVQDERPYIVEGLTPVYYNNQWWLKDINGNMMRIKEPCPGIWKLLALSGGEALPTAVIGKEMLYEPIGVWHRHQYKPL